MEFVNEGNIIKVNYYKKIQLFLVCFIFLISCEGNQNLTEIPANLVPETSDVQEELIPVVPSITPEPYQRTLAGTPLPILEAVISPENVNNIVELARWGNGIIQKIINSPDGKFAVIASSIGFYIYSYEDLEFTKLVEINSDIGGLAISPDNKLLAVGTRENVLIYEIENLNLATKIGRSATTLVFSPDGQMLAMGMGDWHFCRENGAIELWDVSEWTLLQTMNEEADCIGDIIFSPSGKYIAFSNFDVMVWEIINEKESILKFRTWGCDVFEEKLEFTHDEKLIIAESFGDSGRDKICLIRMKDGEVLGVLENDSQVDYSCAPHIIMSPDGKLMASNLDGKIIIWQVDELKQLHTLGDGQECFYSGDWLPDNKTLVTLSTKNQLQMWDVFSKKIIHSETLPEPSFPIKALAWSYDGKIIASGDSRGLVRLWNVGDTSIYRELKNDNEIISLSFSPNAMNLAIGVKYHIVHIWNFVEEKIIYTLGNQSRKPLNSGSFSSDGELFVVDIKDDNSEKNTDELQIWSTDIWRPFLTLKHISTHKIDILNFSISNDKKTIATVSDDGVIRIWDINKEKLLDSFVFLDRLISVIHSPDSNFVAASWLDGKLLGVWSITTGERKYIYECTGCEERRGFYWGYYDNIAWSPDGKIIAIAMPNGSIHLIDATTGNLLKELIGHTMWVTGVSFSPDGKMLASVSLDGTVRLWGIPSQ